MARRFTPVYADAHPGKIRDDYRIGKMLGTGAFSVVREATHRESGVVFAVKIVNKARLSDTEAQRAILLNEVVIMQKVGEIGNPNLMSLKDVYEDAYKLYLVLEVLNGGELFDRIVERGYYSEKDAAALTARIASALKALHDGGIIHRDMKPENLLYTSAEADAEIKVTDFGLAQLVGEPDVHKSLVGTPGYVAPEVLLRKEYEPSCDVWGLGVILYILLVGYPPFYAESNSQLFRQIKAGAFEFHEDAWGEISDGAKDLVSRMLTVDVGERITMEGLLAHPWIVAEAPEVHLEVTMSKLKLFNAKRKFKAAAVACMWGVQLGLKRKLMELMGEAKFELDELDNIKRAFRGAADEEGEITMEKFEVVMSELGFADLPLARLFQLFDKDASETVDYKEFVVGLSTLGAGTGDERSLRFCFDVYDTDASGSISREELQDVLQTLATASDEAAELATAEKLGVLFERMDTDGDGSISFEEFKSGIEAEPVLVAAFLKAPKAAEGAAEAES